MKIKVAILDSGIDLNHEYLSESIIGGVSFEKQENTYVTAEDFNDKNGHGTACASVIKKECKNAEFFIIKILDENAESNLMILETALNYIKETDIRLINMSLSILDKTCTKSLKRICDELEKGDKILVCSLANGYRKSYPAFFKSVIGVKGLILEDENSYWFNKNKKIQAIVDDNKYIHCDLNNSYSIFGGSNSYAAAKMTGIIANIMLENPHIHKKEIYEKLKEGARRKRWCRFNLKARRRFPEFKNEYVMKYENIINKLENSLVEFFNIKDPSILYKLNLYDKQIGVNRINCYDILKKLEKDFDIKFEDYTEVCIDDFFSFYTLAELIIRKQKEAKVNSYEHI